VDGPAPTRAPIRRARSALLLACAVVALAACDASVPPTTPAAPPSAVPSAAVVRTPAPTTRPTPAPTTRPTPTPTPSPTPTPTPTSSPTSASADTLVTPCPGRSATGHEVGRSQQGQSRNWAGYVATRATSFTCVEATWTQPKARCRGTSTQSVVYWVGLGGYNQRSLVQIGTESTCQAGVRVNAAWHESLPRERYSIRTATSIRPGDRIWAQVRWIGGSHYRLSLANLTNRQHFSIRVTSTTLKRTSADWVVEAPSGGCPTNCHPVKMPDFQTFKFRDAWVTTDGRRLQVDASPFVAVVETMVDSAGRIRAEVTSTATAGTGFSIRWRRP
jgi:hypothetical protein